MAFPQRRIPVEYAEHGSVGDLARLIDLVPPAPRLEMSRRFNPKLPLMNFLETVDRRTPRSMEVSVAVTGVPERFYSEWIRWSVRHPRVRLESISNHLAWRSRVVALLRSVGLRPPLSKRLGETGELVRSLGRFVDSYPSDAGAFEWIAKGDEILRRRGAHRLRYDLSVTGHAGFKRPSANSVEMTPDTTPDPRSRAMARTVLRKYLGIRSGERVTIETWSSTLGYANDFVLETLRLGALPLLLYQDEPTYWAATTEVRPENLARIGDHRRAALERTDALVSFFGPSDRERYHALPRATAFKLGEFRDALYHAAAKRGARAVEMAIGRASPASARMYGVDFDAWKNELVEATLVDPRPMKVSGQRIATLLGRGRDLAISHPNGTDLRLRLREYPPEIADGIAVRARMPRRWDLATIPAGVVSVAVDDRFGEGVFRSNVTNSVGVSTTVGELNGGQWVFRKGRLARWNFEEGKELFDQSYARAGPGRSHPASISIGLNPRISLAPLLKDQERGMLTLQIGRNEHLGGSNHATWWAWLLLRGATVTVDGKRILSEGKL